MENRKNQRAKISSATLITDLPEFERENGLLDVNDTVRKIEQKFSPGSDNKARFTRPRVNQQTKDIGYSYNRYTPLARPRSTPTTPKRYVSSPSKWVKVCEDQDDPMIQNPSKSVPVSPSALGCQPLSPLLYGSQPLSPTRTPLATSSPNSRKLFIEKRLEKMRQKTDTLSAASSLLSLNTSSTHMSWEEKSEESSSVFSDATQTGDELDSPRTNSISSNAEQIVEQGVNENSRHNLTDLSDLAINMQSGSAVIESQNCQSDLDYVNLAKKVANEIIESAVVRIKDELTIELEQLANECVNNTLAKVVMESKSLNQNDSWHDETGPLISPYLGTGLKGANYAPALTDNGIVEDGSIQQSSRMKDIESLAAEQVNIAISRARNVLRDEAQKKNEVQVRQRRHKINAQQIKPTEELVTDPTCDTRSDENDNAQIGFVLISLITLFLIIKLVAKLGGFLLDFINQ